MPKTQVTRGASDQSAIDRERTLLDFAVSQSPAIFYIAEMDGARPITFISSNVETMTGHPASAFLADPRYGRGYIHPDDLTGYDRSLDDLRSERSLSHEYRFRTAAGDYLWYRDALRLTRIEASGRDEFVGCMIDITAEKQAEEALRESEQRFRSMVEDHPLPVSMIDLGTGRILYESPAAATIMGREWPPREAHFVGDHYANREDRKAYLARLRRAGEVRDYELHAKKADGTPFWISITSRLIHYQGREVAITSHVDLSERRRREAELRQARETLEDAIESLSEGFALYDADDRLVMCNQRFRDFSRESADVLVPGVAWIDFARTGAERGQYVDAIGRVEDWLKAWAARRAELPMSREFQQSDGRWYESSSQRTRHGGIVVTRTDITHRKEMERVLLESAAMIRRVVEACPVPVVMTRAEDGRVIYESPALQELFGRGPSSDAISARDFYLDAEDRGRYLTRLRERGALDGFEVKLKKTDGTWFWGAVSARLVDYQGEEVIVASILDLTERREVEAEMARQREALHQSEKLSALGELLAGVAHELNNPLSVVVGQALLLKETATDKRIADRAIKIGNAADRCARIVKTFLAMARRKPSESRAVNLNEVVEAALEVTGYSLSASDIDVSLRLARDLPPIWADSDQLNQVLTNLIVNAQHALQEVHGPRKLRISSSFRKQKGEVVVKIKDSGRGIPEEILARIFEPFFTTKEVGTGTGIGLAVCHRIVEAHGGKIRVDGTPGEGASFVIRLPVTGPCGLDAAGEGGRVAAAQALSALVIDDEADVAEILADILRSDGHSVDVARSGEAALSRLNARDFDLILSDLRMPGLDGPSLYRIIEKRKPALLSRLAFVTGDTLSPKIKRFLRGAGRPYIEKPITPREVRELIRRVSGRA
jgi:PAS domain S-box-containing protein